MRIVEYLPEGAGPCAKMHVKATVVALNGNRYVSTNFCMQPQEVCPRAHLPTGVGYELCKSVCKQEGHAEDNASKFAGEDAKGSTLYLEGHYYACDNCQSVSYARGVKEIILVTQ
jgi:deoxycytidylate deaminase